MRVNIYMSITTDAVEFFLIINGVDQIAVNATNGQWVMYSDIALEL